MQRAGPEIYRSIRAHVGSEARNTSQFQDLFTAATIIDFELSDCKRRLQVRRAAVHVVKVINALHQGQVSSSTLTAPDGQCGGRMKVTTARALALRHITSQVVVEVRARRSFDLTGVRAVASLLKAPLDESGYVKPTGVRQVSMIADRMVEPSDARSIPMLDALPAEDAAYYSEEHHVVETSGKSRVLFSMR